MKNLLRSVFAVIVCAWSVRAQAQVPVYSSYPSAAPVIFLDFDGHTVNGTSWNVSGPIYCGSSGLDNAQITEVFNRVAEDYRPFNINVTTDSTKYLAAPANRRTRVIITVTSDWYGSAGGVSFVNSFTWGDNTPAFVFSQLLGFNVKNIAEAASHEAGHTVGLRHQSVYDAGCVKTSEYNPGTGTGEIGWAPIMGVGYYENLTLWHSGPNSLGCNNIQSDLSIITAPANGITFRADDYGSTFAAANNMAFVNSQFTVNGIIEQNTDQDLFKFTLPSPGHFTLDAVPYNVGSGSAGSDLDMQVTMYDGSQQLLGTYNPGMLLSSVIDTIMNAGTYYFRVEGKGNIYAPNYASLGSYSLQGHLQLQTVLAVHKLQLRGNYDQDRHILDWTIEADEQIIDQVLEVSTDGRNFDQLVRLNPNDRSYNYRPATNATALYRLKVKFDNNSQAYSNIVPIKRNDQSKPKIINTFVTNNTISITSPSKYEYFLFDRNGKLMSKGTLSNGMNMVSTGNMTSGLYLIRFSDGDNQWTEKIVKQ